MTFPDKILFGYVILMLLTEMSIIIYSQYGRYTYNVIHRYMFFEFFLFSLFIVHVVSSKKLHYCYKWILSAYVAYGMYSTIYLEPFDTFNSNLRSIENILLILFCLMFYFNLFRKAEVVDLIKYPYFWGVSGMFIHFSGTLFIYIYAKYLDDKVSVYLWSIHSILNILLNISIAYTLWVSSKVEKYKS